MLRLQNIVKFYKDKAVIDNLSAEFHNGDVVGIVGKNGEGKTTLLKMIAGLISPDEGKISFEPFLPVVTYHEQFLNLNQNDNLTIEEYILSLYPDLLEIYKKLNQLISSTNQEAIEKSISLQGIFIEKNGYEMLEKIPNVIQRLGLNLSEQTLVKDLSGGQKTRLQFSKLLLQNSTILLLDEPTNHLDLSGIEWLTKYVQDKQGITLIVSHDRAFLNSVTNKIFEMDDGKYTSYKGNYDEYKIQRHNNIERNALIYESQMKNVRRLEKEASRRLSEARVTDQKFIRGWGGPPIRKVAGKKAKTAQMLLRKVDEEIKENMPEKPVKKDRIKLDIQPTSSSGQMVVKINNLNFKYNVQEFSILKNINIEIWKGDRIAIKGNNGSGKTTLLKLIVGKLFLQLGEIKIGENVSIGYYSQEIENLNEDNTLIDEFRKNIEMTEQDARTFLYYMLFEGEQVFQQTNTLSQGEKSKLSLAILLAKNPNFLILDEPTNHLDIPSREVLENSLKKYSGTILVVSHDKYFLSQIKIDKYLDL